MTRIVPALKTAKTILGRFRAWVTGDWWLPCPVCGEYFSLATAHKETGVKHFDGGYALVCLNSACIEEADRQTRAAY